jgi:hypothetical protein
MHHHRSSQPPRAWKSPTSLTGCRLRRACTSATDQSPTPPATPFPAQTPLLPPCGAACTGSLPFSLLLSLKSRQCPLPLSFVPRPRSALRLAGTFLPLSVRPVHRSRAPKHHHRHRIHTEAPPPFPSTVRFAPTYTALAAGPHRSHDRPPTASSTTEHSQAAPTSTSRRPSSEL